MHNVDDSRLGVAKAKFVPVAQVLDGIAKDIEKEHGGSAVLKRRGAMHKLAENAYTVRYSLRQPDEVRLSLTFTVVGENADLILVQGHERSDLATSEPILARLISTSIGWSRSTRS